MLTAAGRVAVGVANAALAALAVPLTSVLVFVTSGAAPGVPDRPWVRVYMLVTAAGGLAAVALFTRVAVVALRERRWRLGAQAAPIALLLAVAVWAELAGLLPKAGGL